VEIGGEIRRVALFVATLGYSRRLCVRAFGGQRQEHWFAGMEEAFWRIDRAHAARTGAAAPALHP
jgi:transposase